MHATFWRLQDGQLQPGETLVSASPHKDTADTAARGCVACGNTVSVRRLLTWESDYPKDDPRFEEFRSARWGVLAVEKEGTHGRYRSAGPCGG